jgi:hypothetical protein
MARVTGRRYKVPTYFQCFAKILNKQEAALADLKLLKPKDEINTKA